MTATSNPRSNGSADVRHINYQSDFRVVFSFPNNELPQYPWQLELSTPNTPGYNVFVAWYDGDNYHNCKPQEDGSLLVPVDNHDLAPGVLTYKINIDDADADFPDGFMNVTIPGTLAVELWTGPSDEFAGEIGVVVLPVKGDPGPGVASGGKTGQMLAKQSDADYDTVWVDPTSTPTINIVQTTGQSEADVMSQKAVTDALDKKVDAEEGKGLSSNDYTNLDKNKVASAVLFSQQTLTPQQQTQARINIGVQSEHVFADANSDERGMYACDGRIYYINDKGHLSSFNERTFEVIAYDSISPRAHSYNRNNNSSAKRFVVRNDKILFFGSGDTIRQYDLSTQSPIYEIIPISANNSMWYSGLFLEIDNRLFVCTTNTGYDIVEIDFDTGETVKTHSALKDIKFSQYSSFFSYENADLSLFVVSSRIVKYDKASDEFSVVVDASASGENVDISKGTPTCIFKAAQNDTSLYIFTTRGLCVNELSEVLLGKFDSTRNFVAPGGFRSDIFNESYPFMQFSANEFISRAVQCSILNTYDGYLHTLGLSVNADFNRLGYFTKGELGVVYNRGYGNYFRVDALPIYRRYGNDIH